MSQADFEALMAGLTDFVAGQPLDAALEARLSATRGPGSPLFGAIVKACREAVAAGWMCNRKAGGIAYGRVLQPSSTLHGFSVDVVDMRDVVGPHHVRPNGEIDMVMPLTGEPTFDGHEPGWVVYGRGSAHEPTVAGGPRWCFICCPKARSNSRARRHEAPGRIEPLRRAMRPPAAWHANSGPGQRRRHEFCCASRSGADTALIAAAVFSHVFEECHQIIRRHK